jgi:hypothetical protein
VTPIKDQSNNALIAPPANWDDRGGKLRIPALHATKGEVYGVPAVITFWEPSAEELSMLLAGGKVQLTCLGGQPACNIAVQAPNNHGAGILLPH